MRYIHISSLSEAEEELTKIGVDPYGIKAMVSKMNNVNMLLEGVECKIANIMKQEMLSVGGDVAVSRGTVDCSISKTDAIIMGTVKQLQRFADKISIQPFGLKKTSQDIKGLLDNLSRHTFTVKTPEREIKLGERTLIMGILNVTPDSFSDGGMFDRVDDAIRYGMSLEEDGADILDVGGESSRPGADPVSTEDELERITPLLKGLKKNLRVPISVDTTKAEVARVACEEGAEIVNDISALRSDAEMPDIIKRYNVPLILMHMKGTPKTMQEGAISYRSVTGEIIQFLAERMENAGSIGINTENIIIDPGIGFGKTTQGNLTLLKYLQEFKTLGRPILVGTSRKRFIGDITGGEPLDRIEGTAATVTAAVMNGAHIVRVHDVKVMKRVCRMADAIMNG
jgi:dihydropteroate synthase